MKPYRKNQITNLTLFGIPLTIVFSLFLDITLAVTLAILYATYVLVRCRKT